MTDLQQKTLDLGKLEKQLDRGDKRELAKRLGVYPAKVSDAFDGFVRDEEFLSRLAAEAQKLIDEKSEAV